MNTTMTKTELVNEISEKLGLTKAVVNQVLEGILESITEHLKEGDSIRLTGFGSFVSRIRPEMTARNPKTGEPVMVPSVAVPVFRAGKNLKASLAEQKGVPSKK